MPLDSVDALFDAAFLGRLEALALAARQIVKGRQRAERRSDLLGAAVNKLHDFWRERFTEREAEVRRLEAELPQEIRLKTEFKAKRRAFGDSLGQRATVILHILMHLQRYPVILIDQPEDDLDNETLYSHFIRQLLERKELAAKTHSSAERKFINCGRVRTEKSNSPRRGQHAAVQARAFR